MKNGEEQGEQVQGSVQARDGVVGSALKTPAPCGAHTEMLQRAGRHLTPLPGHLNNADKDDRLHVAAKAIGQAWGTQQGRQSPAPAN